MYGYDGLERLTSLTYSLPSNSTDTAPAYVWTLTDNENTVRDLATYDSATDVTTA